MFDQLVESVRQAGRIHRGEVKASRTFVFQREAIRQIRKKVHKSQDRIRTRDRG